MYHRVGLIEYGVVASPHLQAKAQIHFPEKFPNYWSFPGIMGLPPLPTVSEWCMTVSNHRLKLLSLCRGSAINKEGRGVALNCGTPLNCQISVN